jgi:hypothetical protein
MTTPDAPAETPAATCRTCATPIGYVDCPTGSWWAHDQHPADGHDAVPAAWVDGDPLMEAILCGWDCEQDEHDDTCTHGALEEMARLHGWDDDTVAKVRRYRAAVRAVTDTLAGPQQPEAAEGAQQ